MKTITLTLEYYFNNFSLGTVLKGVEEKKEDYLDEFKNYAQGVANKYTNSVLHFENSNQVAIIEIVDTKTEKEVLETSYSMSNQGSGDFYVIRNNKTEKEKIFWASKNYQAIADAIDNPQKGFSVVKPPQEILNFERGAEELFLAYKG